MPEAHRSGGPPVPKSEAEALASVEGAEPVGLPTPRGVVRSLLSVVAQPGPLAREAAQLSRDTLRVVRGSHEITPSPEASASRIRRGPPTRSTDAWPRSTSSSAEP